MSERPQVGVGIIVVRMIDGVEHIMLHQRKSQHGNGYWGSGGGHLEIGESLQDGALRELREEAGEDLRVKNVRSLGVCNFTQMKPKHYVDISFVAEWKSGKPHNTEPEKMSVWQWFPLDTLPAPLFPVLETYIEAYKTGKNFFDSKF